MDPGQIQPDPQPCFKALDQEFLFTQGRIYQVLERSFSEPLAVLVLILADDDFNYSF